MKERPNQGELPILETTIAAASSVAFLYLVSFWGFKKDIKKAAWDRQDGTCGDPGCTKPIDEYHHVLPEKMLAKKRDGVKGLNVLANCIGLCFHHHKDKWDQLAREGVFYPGVKLEELSPDTYKQIHWSNKKKSKSKKGRR